jgi:hypothetical protein
MCYQTDTREIVGLTRMVSARQDDAPGSGDYSCFDLAPPCKALRLDPPSLMKELYASGCHPTNASHLGVRARSSALSSESMRGSVRR